MGLEGGGNVDVDVGDVWGRGKGKVREMIQERLFDRCAECAFDLTG